MKPALRHGGVTSLTSQSQQQQQQQRLTLIVAPARCWDTCPCAVTRAVARCGFSSSLTPSPSALVRVGPRKPPCVPWRVGDSASYCSLRRLHCDWPVARCVALGPLLSKPLNRHGRLYHEHPVCALALHGPREWFQSAMTGIAILCRVTGVRLGV